MDRRGFLKGAFGGVTAAGLIIAANADDIAAFASPLGRDASLVLDAPAALPATVGEHLYNARGELVAIITALTWRTPTVDVTAFGDTDAVGIMGVSEIEIRATGVCTIEHTSNGPLLRGVPRA